MIRFTLLISLLWLNTSFAETQQTLRVGIKPSEPWVMYDSSLPPAQRQPVGFSIDLWRAIAAELNVQTEWVYHDTTSQLVDQVALQQVDVGIAAITILASREQKLDFSNAMYELGLRIMVAPNNQTRNPLSVLGAEIGKLFSWYNMMWFGLMLLVTVHIRWWVDRYDKEHGFLPKTYVAGVQEAFWWGLTMLITWETPKSRGIARLIDISWHLIGLIALSILTAVVTAALTSQAVKGTIQTPNDLADKRVLAVATDAPRDYLQQIGLNPIAVKDLQEGMQLLLNQEADALVHDGPRLLYLADQHNKRHTDKKQKLTVLPAVFNHQNYGLALPTNSPYAEAVNQALLKLRESSGGEPSVHEQLRGKWIPNSQ